MNIPVNTACPYCERQHAPRHLCDPAAAVLEALRERGQSFNMPTIELVDPVPAEDLGLDPGDTLVRQLVVQAATIPGPADHIIYPAIILTGTDTDGRRLPRWLYAGDGNDLGKVSKLVADMVRMAIRGAAQGKTGPGPGPGR